MAAVGRELERVALCVLPCEELTHCPLPLTDVMPGLLLMLLLMILLVL